MISSSIALIYFILGISFYLGALAFFIVLVMMVTRIIYEFKGVKHGARRQEFERDLIHYLNHQESDPPKICLKKEMRMIAGVSEGILRRFDGQIRKDLLKFLKESGFYKKLIKKIRSRSSRDKIFAIRMLSYWQKECPIEEIILCLEDKSNVVKAKAIQAFSYIGSAQSFKKIITFANSHHKNFSALILTDIFTKFGPSIANKLIAVTRSRNMKIRVKIAAIQALGSFDIDLKVITHLCSHKNIFIRKMTFETLAGAKFLLQKPIIINALEDHYWKVRFYALQLASYHQTEMLAEIRKCLLDSNWNVAYKAGSLIYDSGVQGRKMMLLLAQSDTKDGKRACMILQEKLHVHS